MRRRGPQTGVEQREARALGRKARNHFGTTPTFAVQPFQAIRRANPLMMVLGKAQMGDTFVEVTFQALHRRRVAIDK